MKKNSFLLYFILFVAVILRFYKFWDIPFTHDEFSAIFRTQFSSFSELIRQGVMPDGHPAGVQIFLYFLVKIFGFNEFWIKLPFVLAGVLSVYIAYLIAKEWFNESVGLIVAAFFASQQYLIMYSQIARPYIIGLLFTLLAVFYWNKIVFNSESKYFKNSVWFVFFAVLSAYTHYFSLLFVAIVGVSGVFFIPKKRLIYYLLSGLAIIILFVPHLKIFFYQLSLEGLGWLSVPDKTFLWRYLYYTFHFSILPIIVIAIILVVNIFKHQKIKIKFSIISLVWFLLPFLIGYFYSRKFEPVLQFSVLIFSYLYFLLFVFSIVKNNKFSFNLIVVLAIIVVNIFTLINNRDYYNLFYNSVYERILTDNQDYNSENVISIIASKEKISNFYVEKLNIDTNLILLNTLNSLSDFNDFLKNNYQKYDSLYFGCLSNSSPTIFSLISAYYPCLEKQNDYFGGTSFLFSKRDCDETGVIVNETFEKNDVSNISMKNSQITDSLKFGGKYSYFSNQDEYLLQFEDKIVNIIDVKTNFIDIYAKIYLQDTNNDFLIVSTIKNQDSTLYWRGTNINNFSHDTNEWINICHSIKLSDIQFNPKDTNNILKIYFWNKGKNNFYIDDYKIKLRRGNPIIYGLYNDF